MYGDYRQNFIIRGSNKWMTITKNFVILVTYILYKLWLIPKKDCIFIEKNSRDDHVVKGLIP